MADDHAVVCRIATFFVTYAGIAESQGNRYVSKLAAFDLCHVVEKAYLAKNPRAGEVLDSFIELCATEDETLVEGRIRASLIMAGFFHGAKRHEELARIRSSLEPYSIDRLREEAEFLYNIKQHIF